MIFRDNTLKIILRAKIKMEDHKKLFTDPQASRCVVQRSLVASNFASQRPKSLPKRKKSLSDDVFAIKNCLEHRQTSPLTSADDQGPKQVPNNLFDAYRGLFFYLDQNHQKT